MFSSASSTFSLKRPARCIAALASNEETGQEHEGNISNNPSSQFVVGTCCLREANELLIIGFHEESNELLCHQALSHPDEVWSVSPSPRDPSLLLTCSNGARTGQADGEFGFKSTELDHHPARNVHQAVLEEKAEQLRFIDRDMEVSRLIRIPVVNLWRLPAPDPKQDPFHEHAMAGERTYELASLGKPEAEFCTSQTAASALLWGQAEDDGIVTLADGFLKRWCLEDGRFEEAGSATVCDDTPAAAARASAAAAWDPHRPTEVATASGCDVTCWDLRTMKVTTSVAGAHRFTVRDLDYNPNKPFCLVTCAEDRLIKFWDLRKPNEAVKAIVGHDHWVNTVKYNRLHDQLLLSGSSDCMVHLWRVSSVSSAPLLEPDDDDEIEEIDAPGISGSGGEAADIRVRTFDEHEESVYSLAWSASDAWVLASLSYDGQIVLNHVPSTEKYKILL